MNDRIEPPWRNLDPGIALAVRALWSAGFNTTDSGDGVSKPAVGRVFDVPHVFCVGGDDPRGEIETAKAVMSDVGIDARVQWSISSEDGDAVLAVWPEFATDPYSLPEGWRWEESPAGWFAIRADGACVDCVRADRNGDPRVWVEHSFAVDSLDDGRRALAANIRGRR